MLSVPSSSDMQQTQPALYGHKPMRASCQPCWGTAWKARKPLLRPISQHLGLRSNNPPHPQPPSLTPHSEGSWIRHTDIAEQLMLTFTEYVLHVINLLKWVKPDLSCAEPRHLQAHPQPPPRGLRPLSRGWVHTHEWRDVLWARPWSLQKKQRPCFSDGLHCAF